MTRNSGKDIRILIQANGELKQLARLIVRDADASLYIIPYSLTRRYYGDVYSLGNKIKGFETTVDYSTGETSFDSGIPHISIHQSGIVHAYLTGGTNFGEVTAVPLQELQDEHIATISIDSFESLPVFKGTPKEDPSLSQFDQVFQASPTSESARFPIYVNGVSSQFRDRCIMQIKAVRPGLKNPITYCLSAFPQNNLTRADETAEKKPGIVVISGWNINKMNRGEDSDFLLLRGQ